MCDDSARPDCGGKDLWILRHGTAKHNPRPEDLRAAKEAAEPHDEIIKLIKKNDCKDSPLTEEGKEEAKAVYTQYFSEAYWGNIAEANKQMCYPELVVSSPLSRALLTADLALPPTHTPNRICCEQFREVNEKLKSALRQKVSVLKAKTKFPSWNFDGLSEDDQWTLEGEEETKESCNKRGFAGLQWLLDERPEMSILLVAHGSILRYIMDPEVQGSRVTVEDGRRRQQEQHASSITTRLPSDRLRNCELRRYRMKWEPKGDDEVRKLILTEIDLDHGLGPEEECCSNVSMHLTRKDYKSVKDALSEATPFCFLPAKNKAEILMKCSLKEYAPNTKIIGPDVATKDDGWTFLVLKGKVAGGPDHFYEQFEKKEVFGLDFAVLGRRRRTARKAVGKCTIVLVPAETVLKSIKEVVAFRVAVERIFTEKVPVDDELKAFKIFVRAGVLNGTIPLTELLDRYKKVKPVIHKHMLDDSRLDTGAWSYAIARLPKSLTRTHFFLLTTRLPEWLGHYEKVTTQERKRAAKKCCEGKIAIELRDFESDLLDFMSNLCVHCIEARKLRHLLKKHTNYPDLLSSLKQDSFDISEMTELGERDRAELQKIWKTETREKILDIVNHHEDFHVSLNVPRTIARDPGERWTCRLWEEARSVLRLDDSIKSPGDLEKNKLVVHVLQSSMSLAKEKFGSGKGISEMEAMEDTDTGVGVLLVNVRDVFPAYRDDGFSRLILNIGYPIGKQSADIMRCLILLFKKNLRSMSFVGKAGAIAEEITEKTMKESILIAKGVVNEESRDVLQLEAHGIKDEDWPSGTNRVEGCMLTVAGTILQSECFLMFYRTIFNCVGLEMEAYHIAAEIARGKQMGLLDRNFVQRFLFYVSDLPLQGITLDKEKETSEMGGHLYDACGKSILGHSWKTLSQRRLGIPQPPTPPSPERRMILLPRTVQPLSRL